MQEKKLVRSTAESVSRLMDARTEVATRVNPVHVSKHVRDLTKPNSVSKTMRRVGMALIASPDVVTDIPGAALVAGSYVMKKRDPSKLDDLAAETRKILRDIRDLRL